MLAVHSCRLIATVLVLAGCGLGNATLINEIVNSQARMPHLRALYKESVWVAQESKAPQGATSWGNRNAVRYLQCEIDAKHMYVYELPVKTNGPVTLFDTHTLVDGEMYYMATDQKLTGTFGSTPSQFNPLAAGFCVFQEPLSIVVKKHKVTFDSTSLTLKRPKSTVTVQAIRAHDLVLVEMSAAQYNEKDAAEKLVVESWHMIERVTVPKSVVMSFARKGVDFQRRTFELVDIATVVGTGIFWTWRNGAIVKDSDTEIVYRVRNGQLIIDDRFSNQGSFVKSLPRFLILIGCILGGVLAVRSIRYR